MSIETMAIVLHHSQARGTAKLVLLGIANHDGDGGAWPSVATLAKYAGASSRHVQRAIRELQRLGELERVIQAGGNAAIEDHERPNLYHVLLTCPAGCDRTKHHRVRPIPQAPDTIFDLSTDRVTPVSPGDTGVTRGGDTGVTQTVLVNPVGTKSVTYVPRGRTKARCGHELIDDRHCSHGCPVSDSVLI